MDILRKKKSEDQQASSESEAASTKGKSEKSVKSRSTLTFSLPAVVLSLIIPLGMSAAFYFVLIEPLMLNYNQQLINIYAQGYTKQINEKVDNLDNLLDSIASSNKTAQALANPESLEALALKNQYLKIIPGALRIDLVAEGRAKTDKSGFPPINFATVDMMRRTERKQPVPFEVHKVDKQQVLKAVSPIIQNDTIIGTFVVALDFKTFIGGLAQLDADQGTFILSQEFDGAPAIPLVQYGSRQWESNPNKIRSNTNNSHWFVTFHGSTKITPAELDPQLYWGIAGAGAFLLVLSALLASLLLQRAVKKDAEELGDLLRHSIEGKTPSIHLRLKALIELGNDMMSVISNLKTAPAKAQAAGAAQAAGDADPFGSDPLFQNQDVLDIDMSEEDESLLSISNPLAETDSMEVTAISALPETIFRAYDIRGIVGETLTEEIVGWIGKAIGSEALEQGETTIAIGRDGRLSGPALSEALIEGILSTGCSVINLGMVPTPVLYYAANTLNTRSGVMLTGSHNPSNYNGLKIVIAGKTLSGDQIQDLKARVETGRIKEGQGEHQEYDIREEYLERVVDDVVLAKPMKVVVDCGNGIAGVIAEELFTQIGCEVVPLYCDVDGNFPNHHPDPSKPENLEDLKTLVEANAADLGIAFDGDGDRIGVITPKGKMIFPDRLMMLYAKDLLSRNPGADIIFDVKCTRDLADLISNQGGRAIMWKTGHSLIKAKLKETGAVIAGEMSGHIFFNDRWYGFDDALYSAARLLEILAMDTRGTDEIFDEFPENASTPEINVPVTDESKFSIVSRMQEEADFEGGKIITIDGIRVEYEDSWGLIRASNTTPVLVARFEANNEEALKNIKGIFRNELLKIESSLDVPF